MTKIKCADCGKIFTGKSEYDAELKFDDHKCKVNYDNMSLEELRALITGGK